METDPNRVVRWTAEIMLLDATWPTNGSMVVASGSSIESPEEALAKANAEALKLKANIDRLVVANGD